MVSISSFPKRKIKEHKDLLCFPCGKKDKPKEKEATVAQDPVGEQQWISILPSSEDSSDDDNKSNSGSNTSERNKEEEEKDKEDTKKVENVVVSKEKYVCEDEAVERTQHVVENPMENPVIETFDKEYEKCVRKVIYLTLGKRKEKSKL